MTLERNSERKRRGGDREGVREERGGKEELKRAISSHALVFFQNGASQLEMDYVTLNIKLL